MVPAGGPGSRSWRCIAITAREDAAGAVSAYRRGYGRVVVDRGIPRRVSRQAVAGCLLIRADRVGGNGRGHGLGMARAQMGRRLRGIPSAPSRPSRPRLMPCPIRSMACWCTGGAGAGPARRHRAGRGRPQGRERWPCPSRVPRSGPTSLRQPLLACPTWPGTCRDGITEGRPAVRWPPPLNGGSAGTRSGRVQDGVMRDMQATADGLRSAIERSGYYPGLVADAVSSALGSEAVVSRPRSRRPARRRRRAPRRCVSPGSPRWR